MMSNILIFLGLFFSSFTFTSSFTINLTVNVDNEKQELWKMSPHQLNHKVSSLSVTQRQNILMEGWKEDFDKKYEECGFPEVVKCSGKIAEAAATCIQYPDVRQCIQEFVDAELGCQECIEAICKALHIPGC